MDDIIAKFFNRFHQILGYDIESSRQEALLKVEELMAQRCLERLLREFNEEEQAEFKNFTNCLPTPSKQEIVNFLRTRHPSIDWKNIFCQEIQETIKSYVKIMAKNADEEQKKQIEIAFGELVKSYQEGN